VEKTNRQLIEEARSNLQEFKTRQNIGDEFHHSAQLALDYIQEILDEIAHLEQLVKSFDDVTPSN
jgi:hypothetical protein